MKREIAKALLVAVGIGLWGIALALLIADHEPVCQDWREANGDGIALCAGLNARVAE